MKKREITYPKALPVYEKPTALRLDDMHPGAGVYICSSNGNNASGCDPWGISASADCSTGDSVL